jgi:hypothetical protein
MRKRCFLLLVPLVAALALASVWSDLAREVERDAAAGGKDSLPARLALSVKGMEDEQGFLADVVQRKKRMMGWCRDWLGF